MFGEDTIFQKRKLVNFINENLKKMQQNQLVFHTLQLYLECKYIKIFVLPNHTFCGNLVKIQLFKHE